MTFFQWIQRSVLNNQIWTKLLYNIIKHVSVPSSLISKYTPFNFYFLFSSKSMHSYSCLYFILLNPQSARKY